MSTIEHYRGPYGGIEVRRASRELSRIEIQTGLTRARIEAEVDVQASTVDGIAYVTTRAMQDVALVTQFEQQLAQTTPLASGRLAAIADMASLSMAEVVANTGRRLRRCC